MWAKRGFFILLVALITWACRGRAETPPPSPSPSPSVPHTPAAVASPELEEFPCVSSRREGAPPGR
jgi:hypothetical protein